MPDHPKLNPEALVHDLDPGAEVDDPPDDWQDPVEVAIWTLLVAKGHGECADWRWHADDGRVLCMGHPIYPIPTLVGHVHLADIEAGR